VIAENGDHGSPFFLARQNGERLRVAYEALQFCSNPLSDSGL
jgi:hypothetical protein